MNNPQHGIQDPRPELASLSRKIAGLAGLYAIGGGVVTLAGWFLDTPRLTAWDGSNISMLPNTAAAAIAAGAALILATSHATASSRMFAVLAGLIGAATLFQHITGIDLGIDTLIVVRDWGQAATLAPGRMGPPGAISFTLMGTALLLLSSGPRQRRFAVGCAIIVINIALFSIIGYLFGAAPLFSVAKVTGIAFQTATIVMALGIGLVAAAPDTQPMRTLLENSAAGVLVRHAAPLIVVILVGLGALRIWGQQAELYDTAFGTALKTVIALQLLIALFWWAASAVGGYEQSLRETQAHLSLFIEHAPAALAMFDRQMRYLAASQRWRADYGLGTRTLRGISQYDVQPEIPEEWKTVHKRALAGEILRSDGDRFVRSDGRVQWIRWEARPWFNFSNQVGGIIIASEDITARREAEDALRASEERYRLLVSVVTDVPWTSDASGAFASPQPAWSAYTGQPWESQRGFGWVDALHPDDRRRILEIWNRARETRSLYEAEGRLWYAASGEYRYFHARATPILDESENVHQWVGAYTDIHQRKTSEEALATRERLLRTATEHAQVGLVVISPDHRYLYANQAYAEMLGLPTCEIVNRSVREVLGDLYESLIRYRLDRAFAGEHVQVELSLPAGDGIRGNTRLFNVDYEPQTQDGAVGSVVLAITDITERRRAEMERERLLESERAARTQAEQAGRLKDEFLATVSHELRTPLNGILGWAQLLKRTRIDEASVAEGVDAIERGARMQAQIIDDLLDMNRIVSGKLRLEVQNTQLAPVIDAAIETIRPGAEAKGIRLEKEFCPQSGPVKGDPTRLQQVVWNLLSNAAKFTPRGGSIKVRLDRLETHFEIAVSDTGIGIKPEFLPHVFERFRQADSSTTRKHGGLGLGLAIVKQIVELHGGSVSVTSAGENQGATFLVSLPIAETPTHDDPVPTPHRENDGRGIRLPGVRILVVDDDPVACEVLHRLLRVTEAQIDTTGSGHEAIARIAQNCPDLLLCDIGMPGMDGLEVIREVRQRGINIPAVAVTAFARTEDRIRALQAGYSMHLPKPVEANELFTVIAALLRVQVQKDPD